MSAGGHAVRRCASKPATPGNALRAVDRHPAAGDGRGAVRRPARRARRHRPAQRRDPRLRQQAELRSEPVRRRHRRRELEGAQRVARQAAAEPGAARHLPARLDLQALHGAGRADARQAHAAADASSTRATSTSATTASATTRKAATARSTCTSRSSSPATPTTTCSPTTSASTRSHDFMAPIGFGQLTGIDLQGELRGTLPSTEWKRNAYKKKEAQKWYAGETISLGIGQGYNAFTMLQLAQAEATHGHRRRSATCRTWCAPSSTTTRASPSRVAVRRAAAAAAGSPRTSRSSATRSTA